MRSLITFIFVLGFSHVGLCAPTFIDLAINKNGVICIAGTEFKDWVVKCSRDQGQTWKTKTVYKHPVGINVSFPKTIKASPDGHFYLLGQFQPNYMASIVFVSDVFGEGWERTYLNNESQKNISWEFVDLSFSSLGKLFMIGNKWGNGYTSPNREWTTLRSNDLGKTWNLSESISRKFFFNDPVSLAFDLEDSLYVTGFLTDGASFPPSDTPPSYRWLIRKSEDGGQSWKYVYEGPPLETRTIPAKIFVDQTNAIYVVGSENDQLVTLKSDDQGKSWSEINRLGDSIFYFEDYTFSLVSPSGEIFVYTSVLLPNKKTVALWRKTSDGGETWENSYESHLQYPVGLAQHQGLIYRLSRNQHKDFVLESSSDAGIHWRALF